ncbi:fibronectin type III domain-containing protein [Paenibacillus sp. GSMTC-2017]|uniref:fibronectin type III domain-containing protein n=1 Tax=Paenibacillus sp. GSMTC-2017 TaxID=2794350 RepID=UPI0018D775A5|nr:fibronectin type III domain-containing protein [Paenibacillus sp. GSMTC-2017]MBH5316949.1 fibronectin type III domain-containing protein [Paenibacillus sp. GSMTC-2017]
MMKPYSLKISPIMRSCLAVFAAIIVITGVQMKNERVEAATARNKIIVGYWHNFDNFSTNIRLRDISPNYDVIQVAFAEPTGGSHTGNMVFTPYNSTVSDFQADIAFLKARGQKVLISIGGANGTVELTTAEAKTTFVTTMKNIIDTYGFDGLDIDLEGSSLALNAGDTDFKAPTTPKITNLISATREILNSYSADFLLTMAPETAYVQGGSGSYGGIWGAYLPVIYNFRNDLDYLHVQHYNTGPMPGLDGRSYSQGTADFQVAMAEMLLAGFPVGNNPNNVFPALRQDQIVIGLPASTQAAGGGYTTPANVQKALDYLIKGVPFGGTYVLRNAAGYPNFKGLMTWSINWDKVNNFQFSTSHRAYLDQYSSGGSDTTAPTIPSNLQSPSKTSYSVNLSWNASTDDRGVTGYIVTFGTNSTTVTGTSTTISGLLPNTAYTFTVKARDAAGNISGVSNSVTVTTEYLHGDLIAPTVPTNLRSPNTYSTSLTLAWNDSTDNVGVVGYTVTYGTTSLTTNSPAIHIPNLTPNTSYTFTVKAYDVAGNASTASLPLTVRTTSGNSCIVQQWNATTAYTGGQRVGFEGNEYEAKWWTRGERPDLSSVWKLIGPCNDGPGELYPPTAPTNLQSTAITSTTVSLTWGASTDNVAVTGYSVYYGSTIVNVGGTTATITGLSPNTPYTFTVKAKDTSGLLSQASNAVQVLTLPSITDTIAPTPPTNVQASGITGSSVTLSWGASTDNNAVTGYTISYGTTRINVTGTTAVISNLTASTAYTFTVKAFDAAGNSSTGSTVQATTSTTSGPAAWGANVSYKVGDQVTYSGRTYSCRQPHTSLLGWEPTNVPALWSVI